MRIFLPDSARYLLEKLEQSGEEAYVVGGCVRDALRGRNPHDWDLCTSATPQRMLDILRDEKVLKTGLKHGTLTVLLPDGPYEITTYRVDGSYSDGRHPDGVTFTNRLFDDLSRRDFTINAMAYHPSRGLVDPFHGAEDLRNGLIRTVGDADKRFQEDSLRILRGLRFASVMGFALSEDCGAGIHRNRGLLDRVSKERIQNELSKLLLGDGVKEVLSDYPDIFSQIIPAIGALVGFEHGGIHRRCHVWEHTVHAVAYATKDPIIRWTMLLHDIGKSRCFSMDNGMARFYSHAALSAKMAGGILHDLRMDRNTVYAVTQLIELQDVPLPQSEKAVKRRLNQWGEEQLRRLCQVRKADVLAQALDNCQRKLDEIDNAVQWMEKVIREGQCYCIRDLAVNGRDLLAAGIPAGPEIGRMLQHLLELVMDEAVDNRRAPLLEEVKRALEKKETV